jgi:hypothetical protein
MQRAPACDLIENVQFEKNVFEYRAGACFGKRICEIGFWSVWHCGQFNNE